VCRVSSLSAISNASVCSFPFEDPVVVIRSTGSAILAALENGVSLYPALEGRFPQVSNIRFTFDPQLPAGARVSNVSVAGAPLDHTRKYTLATRGYMARGRDGYTSLVPTEGKEGQPPEDEIVSEENGVLISAILRQFFLSLRVVDKWAAVKEDASARRHWDAVGRGAAEAYDVVEPRHDGTGHRTPVQRVVQESRAPESGGGGSGYDSDADTEPNGETSAAAVADGEAQERRLSVVRRVVRKWRRLAGLCEDAQACDALRAGEFGVLWTKVRPFHLCASVSRSFLLTMRAPGYRSAARGADSDRRADWEVRACRSGTPVQLMRQRGRSKLMSGLKMVRRSKARTE
jgi:5'-nucleotidase